MSATGHGFLSRRGFIRVLGGSAVGLTLAGRSHAFSLSSLFGSGGAGPKKITSYITPNEQFYLVAVDTTFRPDVTPRTVQRGWHLALAGLQGEPTRLGWAELMKEANATVLKTFECIGNSVGGPLIGNARWHIISLKKLLKRLPGIDQAGSVMFRSLDDFYSSVSIERCLDDYAFLALQMNGEPLPPAHGFPARVMLPDLYGMKQPRWLKQITLQAGTDTTSFWEERGWAGEVPVKTTSRIDSPGDVGAGKAAQLTGIAYARHRGVSKVEVSLDGGKRWVVCELLHAREPDAWSTWRYHWPSPTAGGRKLMVRATDGRGQRQTAKRHGSYPDGASGYDSLDLDVAAA